MRRYHTQPHNVFIKLCTISVNTYSLSIATHTPTDETSVDDLHADEADQALQQTLQAINESEAASGEEEEISEAEVDDNASVESFSDIRHSKVRYLIQMLFLFFCALTVLRSPFLSRSGLSHSFSSV